MQIVILETLNETEQLAKQLEGNTDLETFKNIKDFAYWHIQYLQDKSDQQLYSPARTWANRSIGVDCKSFSILISSILTNLGYENSLRQIKQKNYNADFWTHVYVVVPKFNIVIDGTVPYDHESIIAEKYDEPISKKGLNGLSLLSLKNKNNLCNINSQNSCFGWGSEATGKARLPFKNVEENLIDNSTDHESSQVRNNGKNTPELPQLSTSNSKKKAPAVTVTCKYKKFFVLTLLVLLLNNKDKKDK